MNCIEIYEIIEKKRLELDWSVSKLCRMADVSQSAWNYIKTDHYNMQTLSKFCKVLGIKEVTIKFDVN